MNFSIKFLFVIRYLVKKIILKNNKFTNNTDQFVIFSNDYISSEIILNQYYEKNILFFLKNEIFKKYIDSSKDICLDIGANIGNHSNFFSEYFFKIISFEPNKKSYELLKINTKNKKNIYTYNLALSDNEKIKNFFENKNNYGASKVINNIYDFDNKNIIKIQTKILDNVILDKDLKNIKYIKIDTEDHDINIIKGSKNFLKNNSPFLSIELKKYDYNKNYDNFEIILILKQLGYRYFYNVLKYKKQNKHKLFILKLVNFLINYKSDESYFIEKINIFLPIDYEFLIASKDKIL